MPDPITILEAIGVALAVSGLALLVSGWPGARQVQQQLISAG